jgi:hypothetical protein
VGEPGSSRHAPQQSPNSCRGVGARISQGRDGRGRGRNLSRDTPVSAAVAASIFVGIDVSKAALDVALRPGGEAWRCTNDDAGVADVVSRLQPLVPHLIVL